MARHGENIHKRKDGRWEARVIYGYSEEGKAKYRYLYGKTYPEVKEKRNALLGEIRSLAPQPFFPYEYNRITFEQVVREWMEYRKETVKESTYVHYMNLTEKHLLPELGHLYLSALSAEILDGYLKKKLTAGRLDGKGGLSAKTVADIRSVLLMCLSYAERRKYPCTVKGSIFYPRVNRSDIRIFTRKEQEKLEQVLFYSKEPFELGILLTLYSGMRIGEVCALQWRDINLEDGTMKISKSVIRIRDIAPNAAAKTKVIIAQPKTISSIRTIPLPSFLIRYIARFRCDGEKYVLTGTVHYMEPRICLSKYKNVLKRAGMQDYTYHTLRHTFATRCVESGFDTKSLSELLGHANVGTTLQRYVHPTMEMKKEQIERLERISIHGQKNGQETEE